MRRHGRRQIAVSVYLEELEKLLTADQTPQQLLEASAQAAALANQAIQAEAERREECRNMGTTLVSAISYDGGVVVTNVGDSRAYHITEDGPDTCLDRLLAIAKRQGAPDNVTAVLMQKQ